MNVTVQTASSGAKLPWLDVTPALGLRIASSISLMCMGLYFLASGREQADLSRMTLGALLSIASLLVF